MKLSNNFNLSEMLQSQTATRKQIKEQFNPPQEVIDNLKQLTVNVLQPIRDALGCSIRISSGYRCARLNKAIGGSLTSQHSVGQAADINNHCGSDIELAKIVVNNGIKFDQMIIEFGTLANPNWIHISYNPKRNRGQILRAYKSGRRTVYKEISANDIKNA
jgi:uncharacterized protein YcbK (DUF882 family)